MTGGKGAVVNIIECHFEFSGFDDRLVKAGTAVYLWNLCQQFHAAGHDVTALTAAHGLLPTLRASHEVTSLGWRFDGTLPIRLDPRAWPGYPEQVMVPVSATAHLIRISGINVIMLAGGMLDEHSNSFYPPAELEGVSLSFLKPVVFQAVAARFLADTAAPGTVVHLHEPRYHFLIPAALRGTGLVVVSTVQTNLAINTKVYGPQVRTLMDCLGGDPTVTDCLDDPPLDTPLERAMRSFLPGTLLYQDYPERPGHDYVSMLGVIVRCVDALDFLSPGQLEHALSQAGTPFEQLFQHLAVRRELHSHLGKLVVGGCAIGTEWFDVQRGSERRERVLSSLGLDPALPTLYHNARYAPQHKGQRELARGLRQALEEGDRFNVLLHCLAPTWPNDPELYRLTDGYPDLVRLQTGPMTRNELMDWAASSDLCLFPSKFEMDTFLIAMGEAMASGAVPIATAQQGMRHFGHAFDLDAPTATGLALPRSFAVDDPALVEAIREGTHRMLSLLREDPVLFGTLRARAIGVARQFTWERAAARFLAIFAACATGTAQPSEVLPAGAASGALPGAATATDTGLGGGQDVPARAWEHDGVVELCWGPSRGCGGATRVRVVVPGQPPDVVALEEGADGRFRGQVRGSDSGHLALLITLASGRESWQAVTVEGTGQDAGT